MTATLEALRTLDPARAEFKVTRLSPAIGAEVTGIDLAGSFSAAQIGRLWDALFTHKVLVFRDQNITAAEHVELARNFGNVQKHPSGLMPLDEAFPEILLLDNDEKTPPEANIFHTDLTSSATPPYASLLKCSICPEVGGDTIWIDMVTAYKALPDSIKQELVGLLAVHDHLYSTTENPSLVTPEQRRKFTEKRPPVEHPVVVRHPQTGEEILFVNEAYTAHISNYRAVHSTKGPNAMRNLKLLQFLLEQPRNPDYQFRVGWRPGTVVMWDNYATQHYPLGDYYPARRSMRRVTILHPHPEFCRASGVAT